MTTVDALGFSVCFCEWDNFHFYSNFYISGMCLLGFCLLLVDNNNIPAGTSIKRVDETRISPFPPFLQSALKKYLMERFLTMEHKVSRLIIYCIIIWIWIKTCRETFIHLPLIFLKLTLTFSGRAGVPMEVMGLMLGEFVDDYTVRVIDVFAMPQSGTVSSH